MDGFGLIQAHDMLCALLLCTAATYLTRGTSPPPEVEDPCPRALAGTEQVINIYLTDE